MHRSPGQFYQSYGSPLNIIASLVIGKKYLNTKDTRYTKERRTVFFLFSFVPLVNFVFKNVLPEEWHLYKTELPDSSKKQ
jgi:hypothetical protein